MQTGSGPSASRLPTVITAIAVVLAVIGFGGLVSGAAEKPSDKVASSASSTTTTEVSTTLVAGATTTTTVGAGSGATTTTTKRTTATTGSGGPSGPPPGDCPSPATATDPGPNQPPAVGTYVYVTCDGKESSEKKVEAYQPRDPQRRLITQEIAGFTQTGTVFYGPNGNVEESFTVQGFVTCDWKPDLLQWPTTVAVGATFATDSSCTISSPQGTATIRFAGTSTITGKVLVTVGSAAANAWSVYSTAKLTTQSKDKDGKEENNSIDIVATRYFDPTRGVDLYRHLETKGTQGSGTVIERIKSLTPKKNS